MLPSFGDGRTAAFGTPRYRASALSSTATKPRSVHLIRSTRRAAASVRVAPQRSRR